ncbi:response regulator [Burkholderia sp. SG-MS1]|uniref:response regulator n=1 Tax=Paraburkholderia sp. SG-MS1 TaxID=2023741 RepID=UPI00144759C0|nr:response regulator [Paraburkholderia sp. SG-MS1]NKJ48978.1 response regulator [Paraburkholderia sp. SG-MS1]
MATVLVVDDDLENRWALQLALENRGYHVVLAENGRDALRRTSLNFPALVITDWQMPEMDGAEFCRRLKCQPAFAATPVILLSAMPERACGPRCWVAFLRKPAAIEKLLHIVDGFIAERLPNARATSTSEHFAPSRWRAIDSKCWP